MKDEKKDNKKFLSNQKNLYLEVIKIEKPKSLLGNRNKKMNNRKKFFYSNKF